MDVSRGLDVLRRRWLLLLTAVALTVLAAMGVRSLLPTEYEARALLHVATPPVGIEWRQYDLDYSDRLMNTYVTLAGTDRVKEVLTARLGGGEAPHADLVAIPSTGLLEAVARGATPERAAAAANALVAVIVELAGELFADPSAGEQPQQPRVVALATPPQQPRGLDTTWFVLVAVAAGAIIGLLAAFSLDNADDRLHYADEAGAVAGLPVLAAIPRVHRRRNALARADSAEGRAYRRLRAQLLGRRPGRVLKSVLLCGVSTDSGTSTVAANLGRDLAVIGRRVLVIECDITKPAQRELLGVRGREGILSLLAKDSARRVPHATDVEGLQLIVTRSVDVPEVLAEHGAHFDTVIVDGSTLTRDADALYLTSFVEEVLLVVKLGRARAVELADARDQLTAVGARIVGLVAVGVGAVTNSLKVATFAATPPPETGSGDSSAPGVSARMKGSHTAFELDEVAAP